MTSGGDQLNHPFLTARGNAMIDYTKNGFLGFESLIWEVIFTARICIWLLSVVIGCYRLLSVLRRTDLGSSLG